MSVGYSLLAGILAIAAMGDDNFSADYSPRGEGWPLWRGALTALGAVTFAYGGHRCDTGHAVFSGKVAIRFLFVLSVFHTCGTN